MKRRLGIVQLTGKHLLPGQSTFPERTPADPVAFVDEHSGHAFIYGTQVEGHGITFLRYPNLESLLAGGDYERISRDVYLPSGHKLQGKEAIWDTLRLAYDHLKEVFPRLDEFYLEHQIKAGTDLYYGGVALKADGSLGDFPNDNWRRRIHPIVERDDGRLELIAEPVFNPISTEAKTSDYIGFGLLPGLPGNYLGHAYGPNFKIEGHELWMIHEEVCRRIPINSKPVEITEIFARRMLSPFAAVGESVRLVSVESADGHLSPDACRGPLLNYTKLLEGFRPAQVAAGGIRMQRRARLSSTGELQYQHDPALASREFFFLTGSSGNFCGDDYDVIMAWREGSAIGPYQLITLPGSPRWKRYLRGIKEAHGLSWAGRGSFVSDAEGSWWLLFHAVDKAHKPEGSYTGEIPANTEEYHRNVYLVPIEFVINLEGQPDVLILHEAELSSHAFVASSQANPAAFVLPFDKASDHLPSKPSEEPRLP